MIRWESESTRSNHMYRCAYCSSITTARHRTVGRRVRGSLVKVQDVVAYECRECGGTTCFDGGRQIPAVNRYPNCRPLEQHTSRATSRLAAA